MNERPREDHPGCQTLYCPKCTREVRFSAPDRATALRWAKEAGWKFRGRQTICPQCP